MRIPYERGTVRVTSVFGKRTLNGVTGLHKGIDLVGCDKEIVSPCDGVVEWAGELNDKSSGGRTWEWGKYVRIGSDDGMKVYLCHLSAVYVKSGYKVKAGDKIGVEGNTGYSLGSHCHVEIRKNGMSIDPSEFLGIQNKIGTYPVAEQTYFTKEGLTFRKSKNFRVVYFDNVKSKIPGSNCCNGNFFGEYKRDGVFYTLPRGNLVCDIGSYVMQNAVKVDLGKYVSSGKIRYSCRDNAADSNFRDRYVSTLIIPTSGKPYVSDVNSIPDTAKYAISGVPCLRNGEDVDWHNYVMGQGWAQDIVRNTEHNWVGIRDGEIWIITGKSKAKTGNFIYGMWFYNIIKDQGFEDILCLDGGGSYFCKINGKKMSGSTGNRQINAYCAWE